MLDDAADIIGMHWAMSSANAELLEASQKSYFPAVMPTRHVLYQHSFFDHIVVRTRLHAALEPFVASALVQNTSIVGYHSNAADLGGENDNVKLLKAGATIKEGPSVSKETAVAMLTHGYELVIKSDALKAQLRSDIDTVRRNQLILHDLNSCKRWAIQARKAIAFAKEHNLLKPAGRPFTRLFQNLGEVGPVTGRESNINAAFVLWRSEGQSQLKVAWKAYVDALKTNAVRPTIPRHTLPTMQVAQQTKAQKRSTEEVLALSMQMRAHWTSMAEADKPDSAFQPTQEVPLSLLTMEGRMHKSDKAGILKAVLKVHGGLSSSCTKASFAHSHANVVLFDFTGSLHKPGPSAASYHDWWVHRLQRDVRPYVDDGAELIAICIDTGSIEQKAFTAALRKDKVTPALIDNALLQAPIELNTRPPHPRLWQAFFADRTRRAALGRLLQQHLPQLLQDAGIQTNVIVDAPAAIGQPHGLAVVSPKLTVQQTQEFIKLMCVENCLQRSKS